MRSVRNLSSTSLVCPDAAVLIFDWSSRAVLGEVAAANDADSIIYDPASNRVLVFCGDAHQMVAIAHGPGEGRRRHYSRESGDSSPGAKLASPSTSSIESF